MYQRKELFGIAVLFLSKFFIIKIYHFEWIIIIEITGFHL